ncbi:MAG: hypothetical protein ACI9JN_002815 [Bacteroidia bacterium]|jgi:hypothetical protein
MNPLVRNKLEKAKKRHVVRKYPFLTPENHIWVLNPFTQTFLWVGALLFGATSSLLSPEIIDFSFSTQGMQNPSVNWYTVLFTLTLILLAFGFAISSWVSRTQDSLVIDNILTMPPTDFWQYYGEEFSATDQFVHVSQASLVEETGVEEALLQADIDVRRILDVIINLVKKWDSSNIRNSNVVYRANLMTVHYFEDEAVENLEKKIDMDILARFSTAPVEIHYCGFVCLLSNVHTTTTETNTPSPDESRKPIAFPFTQNTTSVETPIFSNLKGAPAAVTTCLPSYVEDVDTIAQEYTETCNLKDSDVEKALLDYYDDKEAAKSILSLPLLSFVDGKAKWVVNIYRNESGLLFDGDKVSDFAEIIKPYLSILNRLLGSIEYAQNKQ